MSLSLFTQEQLIHSQTSGAYLAIGEANCSRGESIRQRAAWPKGTLFS